MRHLHVKYKPAVTLDSGQDPKTDPDPDADQTSDPDPDPDTSDHAWFLELTWRVLSEKEVQPDRGRKESRPTRTWTWTQSGFRAELCSSPSSRSCMSSCPPAGSKDHFLSWFQVSEASSSVLLRGFRGDGGCLLPAGAAASNLRAPRAVRRRLRILRRCLRGADPRSDVGPGGTSVPLLGAGRGLLPACRPLPGQPTNWRWGAFMTSSNLDSRGLDRKTDQSYTWKSHDFMTFVVVRLKKSSSLKTSLEPAEFKFFWKIKYFFLTNKKSKCYKSQTESSLFILTELPGEKTGMLILKSKF